MRCTLKTLVVLLILLCNISFAFAGDSTTLRRLSISAAIFPRIVGVDQNLPDKLANNQVVLQIVYHRKTEIANRVKTIMQNKVARISGHPIEVKLIRLDQLNTDIIKGSAGLFIADPLQDREFSLVSQLCRSGQRICFSPYPGDVERGILAGIYIDSQIRPYFNREALRASGVNINPILLKASKTYE